MAAGDRIDALAVYLYYDWICHICDNQIDPSAKHPDLSCASIDHVVPLALGGTHTWDNVKPAHLGCGADKGIELPPGATV